MDFYERKRKGERIKSYQEAAQELAYRVSRTDDPAAKPAAEVADRAMKRADARAFAGNTHWVPGVKWNHKEVD